MLVVRRLLQADLLRTFRSGVEPLDVFLRSYAKKNQTSNLSQTWLSVDGAKVANIANSKLNSEGQRAQLDFIQALNDEKLKKDNDRYKDLFEGKAASEVSYDEARFQFENAKVKAE